MIPHSSIAHRLAALEALPILPCIQRYMGYIENPCLCISGPPLSTRAASQPFVRVLGLSSLLAKRSRRLSAGYIWTSTGAQGCWPPANRMAQNPARLHIWSLCGSIHGWPRPLTGWTKRHHLRVFGRLSNCSRRLRAEIMAESASLRRQ